MNYCNVLYSCSLRYYALTVAATADSRYEKQSRHC